MVSSLKLIYGWQRALLLIPALLILLGGLCGFCWFFANSLAANAERPDVAAVALFLSPADPLAHSQVAAFKTRSFNSAELPAAAREFEQAAALSPNDYRYWYALARMHERLGDAARAELAANRALELAPNYAPVLWLDGNILLRRGEQRRSFEMMRRAAEADSQYAAHFITAIAQTNQIDDLDVWQQTVGEDVAVRAALLAFLMQTKKFDQAAQVWNQLPNKEKRETGKDLSTALLDAKKYRAALPIYQLMALSEAEKPQINSFLNPGFENDLPAADDNPFAWQIAPGGQPQIAPFESAKHSGARSLIVFSKQPASAEFRVISQTVATANSGQYRFETWVKTEGLQSSAPIFWEAVDTIDGNILTKTAAVPAGDKDWQKLSMDFKTGAATEAVTFRLVRAPCAQSPFCTISGKILFDDFTLQKLTNN